MGCDAMRGEVVSVMFHPLLGNLRRPKLGSRLHEPCPELLASYNVTMLHSAGSWREERSTSMWRPTLDDEADRTAEIGLPAGTTMEVGGGSRP